MPESFQDMRGYYAILRLSPSASVEEVEQAHQALEEEWRRDGNVPRFQIQEAYRFLSDAENKSAYDAQRGPEAEPPSKTRTMMLSGIMMFLFVIAGFVFPGFLLGVPESFRPQILQWLRARQSVWFQDSGDWEEVSPGRIEGTCKDGPARCLALASRWWRARAEIPPGPRWRLGIWLLDSRFVPGKPEPDLPKIDHVVELDESQLLRVLRYEDGHLTDWEERACPDLERSGLIQLAVSYGPRDEGRVVAVEVEGVEVLSIPSRHHFGSLAVLDGTARFRDLEWR